ncbi:MAG: hypothetical protein Q7L55_09485 [Actinomycetota bacterium]|nr:hypothetical protein [Actinomycetota bacterium]
MTNIWINNSQARPRYRSECPLLWRAPGIAQIGEGRLHRIVSLDPGSAQWLLTLDGLRTVAQLMAQFADRETEAEHRWNLLVMASQIGAIDDAGSMPEAWRLITTPERDSATPDHAAALLTLGSSWLADQALNLRHRTHYAIRGTGELDAPPVLAEATRQAMRAAGLTASIDGGRADLLIIIGLHPVIGAEVAAMELAQPASAHLFVSAYGDRGVAGPLVVPGQTSCLRCSYLHTRDADPHWAGVSMQLHAAISRLSQAPIDRLLAQLIASQAARLARAWVDSPVVVGNWSNLAYEIRLPDGTVDEQARPAHALCECQWVIEPAVAG